MCSMNVFNEGRPQEVLCEGRQWCVQRVSVVCMEKVLFAEMKCFCSIFFY